MTKLSRPGALTLQIDMAEGAAAIMSAAPAAAHFQRIADSLKRERERELGPVPNDIAGMNDDELLAALSA